MLDSKKQSTRGKVEAEDQSTYVLPYSESLQSKEVADAIVVWSKNVVVSSDDFVQLFYLVTITSKDNNVAKIGSRFLKYDTKTKGLKRTAAHPVFTRSRSRFKGQEGLPHSPHRPTL